MLIIATHNAHKLQEISEILAPLSCIGASHFNLPEPEETGLSFIENALIKARYLSQETKQPVIADDSGLVVPSLNGAPGIYSARYAGPKANDESNRKLLLENMQGISSRFGYFYCAMVYLRHAFDPSPLIGLGQWNGTVIDEERGSNGFGYDPIFYIDSLQCTAAQLSAPQKNLLSHRGQALTQLKQQLIHHDILSIP